MRCYLAGCMDRADDGGVGWRRDITPYLQELGVIVMDPTNKPIDIGVEDIENRKYRESLKRLGLYEKLASQMKEVRRVDLRMIDVSDFMIAYLDLDILTCGTWEEIFWANRMKRPVLVVCKQGKVCIPDWMFAVLPHEHMFDGISEALSYLRHVCYDDVVDDMGRWMFFDYSRLISN